MRRSPLREDPGQGEMYLFALGVLGPPRIGPSGERTLQVGAGFRSLLLFRDHPEDMATPLELIRPYIVSAWEEGEEHCARVSAA